MSERNEEAESLSVFIVAGEPSGDALGGSLMTALVEETGGNVCFAGIGGEMMTKVGLATQFPMSELSIMGLVEVLPRLPALVRRLCETEKAIVALKPDVVITIDSPGFTLRLAKRLKGKGILIVHYVAPTVWAWKPGRAPKMARVVDHLLTLLPFEPPYFEAVGLRCSFVGHPVVESGADQGDGVGFRRRHGIDAKAQVIAVLPGSRQNEIGRHLPIFGDAMAYLMAERPGLRIVVPTIDVLADSVKFIVDSWPGNPIVVRDRGERFAAFAAADAALAASGTVALELAMARIPAVIAYRMNPLTAWLARRLVKVRYANLINIILDRCVVPELLQENCRGERLAYELARLLDDPEESSAQTVAAGEALSLLGYGGKSPGRRAACEVLSAVDRQRNLLAGT